MSEEFRINTHLQWIPEAGREGFIVLKHNLQDYDQDNNVKSTTSDPSIRFKYTSRF